MTKCIFEFKDNKILNDLKKAIPRKKYDKICLGAAKIIQKSIKESARDLIPGNNKNIVDSIVAETYIKEGPNNAFVLSSRRKAFYNLFFEEGTGPRIAKGKVLRTKEGKFLGKEVAPIKATHFFQRGIDSSEGEAKDYIEKEAEKLIKDKIKELI